MESSTKAVKGNVPLNARSVAAENTLDMAAQEGFSGITIAATDSRELEETRTMETTPQI